MTTYNTQVAANTEALKLELTSYGSWDKLQQAECFMLDAKTEPSSRFFYEISI